MDNKIDTTVSRTRHVVYDVGTEQCKQWLNSPITKALISILDRYSIAAAVQFEEYEDGKSNAILHMLIPFDIKKAIIDRQKKERVNS